MKRGNKEGGNKRVPQNKLFPASRVFPLLGKIFQAKDESKGVGGFSTVLAKVSSEMEQTWHTTLFGP